MSHWKRASDAAGPRGRASSKTTASRTRTKSCLSHSSLSLCWRPRCPHVPHLTTARPMHAFRAQVDKKKVKMELIYPWVTSKITQLLGNEDEVTISYFINLLQDTKEACHSHVPLTATDACAGNRAQASAAQPHAVPGGQECARADGRFARLPRAMTSLTLCGCRDVGADGERAVTPRWHPRGHVQRQEAGAAAGECKAVCVGYDTHIMLSRGMCDVTCTV